MSELRSSRRGDNGGDKRQAKGNRATEEEEGEETRKRKEAAEESGAEDDGEEQEEGECEEDLKSEKADQHQKEEGEGSEAQGTSATASARVSSEHLAVAQAEHSISIDSGGTPPAAKRRRVDYGREPVLSATPIAAHLEGSAPGVDTSAPPADATLGDATANLGNTAQVKPEKRYKCHLCSCEFLSCLLICRGLKRVHSNRRPFVPC